MRSRIRPLAGLLLAILLAVNVHARTNRVTSPKEQFGFDIGDDYQLANYAQLTEYWKKLDQESDRLSLVDIGKTAEGRSQWMAIVTSPENHKKLARYKEISSKLAKAEGLTDQQARALAAEGKAVVWIDGGLHATEVLGAQQLIQTSWELVSKDDPETLRLLNDVIILLVHANPDGMDLVSNWYMREKDPLKRSTNGIPRLYQKYIGHDNNRDFYMVSQKESENMNRILYREWFPQIMYNHHQTGPTGTVMFAPPFRDPFNYVYDPLVPVGIDLVGAAMHNRFVAENKPGVTMRRGSGYSTWWNGGLRTTVYFHNMIGLLTETIGNPTPMEIPFVPQRNLPSTDLPYPITPQKWHFKQSIEYSITANRAVLDVASKHREDFLYNIYQMGRNSIKKGSQDTWTTYPKDIDNVHAAIKKETGTGGQTVRTTSGGGFAPTAPGKFFELLRDPAHRDPRGYIIPSDQADFPTATKFVNTLIKNGITIHRAKAAFTAAGKQYPAGSYVVKTAQAFRPHVLDMFEPQDHPNDFAYPGGPPTPPYDSAGWTLAYQMGVQFDRVLDAFDGSFEVVPDLIAPPPATMTEASGTPAGYVLSHAQNDAFIAINRLLKGGDEVYFATRPIGPEKAPGAIYVPAGAKTAAVLKDAASKLGVSVTAVAAKPADADLIKLKPVRIALWDQYGGSMPSGWVRFLLENFEFPFDVIYPQALDAGNLNAKYDVIIFVDGGVPERDGGGRGFGQPPSPESIPAEFRDRLGRVSVAKTVPQIKTFLENGGTVLAIGSSTSLAEHLKLPLTNALVEVTPEGEKPLGQDKFYVPGSVLRVSVDNTNPLAYGMPSEADVFFDHSPVFRARPEAQLKGVHPVAWFPNAAPLRSGWAWGQDYLEGGVAVAEATVGKGKLFLYGPEITFRSQPHGTFKFLFNGIYYGPAAAGKSASGASATQTAGAAR